MKLTQYEFQKRNEDFGRKGIALASGPQPVASFYVEQWERLLDSSDEIRQFVKEHEVELEPKGA